MTTRVLPDVEAIAIGYMLTRSEVTDLCGTRIGTSLDLTADTQLPALRVRRVSATTNPRRHLRAGNTQLEAWATSELAAQDLCETALAVLLEDGAGSIVGTHSGLGVVTAVDEAIGPRPQADPETDTPRWLAAVIIYAHPIPS